MHRIVLGVIGVLGCGVVTVCVNHSAMFVNDFHISLSVLSLYTNDYTQQATFLSL